MRRSQWLLLSVRSQMLVEKMNAFYLKNWDKETMFDVSQQVKPRKERHWSGKLAPRMLGQLKSWKNTYTHTPYHKSDNGQSPGDIMTGSPKKKYFWIDPPADYYLHANHPGGQRDFHLAWSDFYKELEKAAYSEPEQVLTLLHDLGCEGWTLKSDVYDKADNFLVRSRERRALGIKPPITLQEVKGKERWPGALPVFDEEWDPILPFTQYSQANPAWSYKPIAEKDWVHDPAPWMDKPLPPPDLTQMEDKLQLSPQRRNILLQKEADDRFHQLLEGQHRDIYRQYETDPHSFAGNPDEFTWLLDERGEQVKSNGVPILLYTDINHFIELFYPGDVSEIFFMWKYTADHVRFRHFVFEKTGKTLLEYTEPERFAILLAILDVKKTVLFDTEIGRLLPHCWTDADYLQHFDEEDYRKFLRMEGRRVDEERRRYLRLWSTEVAQEERLDQVVELTRMRHEEEDKFGLYGGVQRVKDRMDRKKWALKEPSRQVQEHEKLMAETKDERRGLFDEEMDALREEARLTYGDEVYGRYQPRLPMDGSGKLTPDIPFEDDDNPENDPNRVQ